jgi:hypothetical protein
MNEAKTKIINNLCYTEAVYDRINKKLKSTYSKEDIELMLLDILKETDKVNYIKKGKNYYISNSKNNIRITINSNTFRVITVDRLNK